MRKVALPIALVLLMAACSSPTDAPALQWIRFLEQQAALVKSGKFNAANFDRDGAPIVEELGRHRNGKSGELLMTKDVLEKFRAANIAFEQSCDDAGNKQAKNAYDRLTAPLRTLPEE